MGRQRKKVFGELNIDLNLPEPNEKQERFFLARQKYIAYGGARAGGKSWAVRVKAVTGAMQCPGIRILIMRRTYPELDATIIQPLVAMINEAVMDGKPAGPYIADYNATMRTVFFRNGSIIKFGNLNTAGTITEYQGQEYDWIFMDEATHFTEHEFRTLGACLRGVNAVPKRFYLTCNPGGVGHQWVKRLFITRAYDKHERPQDYGFIPATVEDNTALSDQQKADYIDSLELLPDDIRAAHRYGDWDALAGQYFSEFRREAHVIAPFAIPRSWPRYRVFDYGLDMLACYWIAVDSGGRAYVYREYCESGLIVSDAARGICERTPPEEVIVYTIAPPDMWTTLKDTGRTMAELFQLAGVGLVKASNSRVQGWLNLKEYLKTWPDGRPGMLVFDHCVRLIRDLPALQHSDRNPSDCATEPHDITHAPDAIRYFCMYRKLGAAQEEVPCDEDEGGQDYGSYMCGGVLSESYLTT